MGTNAPASPGLGGELGLKRTLSLSLLVLYGLGVTVGAGIYVLIGAASARAGIYAPAAFLIAAVAMGLSAASFSELSARLPVASGEAAFVRAGFGSDRLAVATGLLVVVAALVASAAIAKGAAGYLSIFLPLPIQLLTLLVILAMGAIAARGIGEAASIAAVMTVVEIGGLISIVTCGLWQKPELTMSVVSGVPMTLEASIWRGVLSATLLAFFAFIGFEGIVNLAEEAHSPSKLVPRAIFLTLLISTVLYILVVAVANGFATSGELGASKAPLSLVFERTTGASPLVIAAIAVMATINGVIAQIVLASRVLYGLARQGHLPEALGRVHGETQAPRIATLVVIAIAASLAMSAPIEALADWTTRVMLVIFAAVNLALVAIKLRGEPAAPGIRTWPVWIPLLGAIVCLSLLVLEWILPSGA
jgi:amino acid transporter